MKEGMKPTEATNGKVKFIDEKQSLEAEGYPKLKGINYARKYRGNHRSQVRGVGMKAFLRSAWMLRYHR